MFEFVKFETTTVSEIVNLSGDLSHYGVTQNLRDQLADHAERDPLTLSQSLPDPASINFKALFGHLKGQVAQTLAIAKVFKLFARPRLVTEHADGTATFFERIHIGIGDNGEFIGLDDLSQKELHTLLTATFLLSRPSRKIRSMTILGHEEYKARVNFIEKGLRQFTRMNYVSGTSAMKFEHAINGSNVKSEAIVSGALRRMMQEDLKKIAFRAFKIYDADLLAYQKIAMLGKSVSTDGRKRTIQDLWMHYRPAIINEMNGRGAWRKPEQFHNDVENYPAMLRNRGNPPSVWRMLLKMSTAQIKTLLVNANGLYNERIIRLSQIGGETVPATALREILKVPDEHMHFYAEAARKARKKGEIRHFNHRALQVLDLLNNSNRQFPRNATWATLERISDEWHEWLAGQGNAQDNYAWSPLLGTIETRNGTARELVNSAELAVEGRERRHCVGSFGGGCYRGESRIFALSTINSKGRTYNSTLQLRAEQGKWTLAQHYSTANSKPVAELTELAREVLSRANRNGAFAAGKAPIGWEEDFQKEVVETANPLERYPLKPSRRDDYRRAFAEGGELAEVAF